MPKSKFLFSLVRAQAPKKKLKTSPNRPVTTNLTPLQIRIQKARRRRKGTAFEFVQKNAQDWPDQAKCYLQIWELDKWKKGRRKGKENDAGAAKTGNDLVKEIKGFIKEYGPKDFRFVASDAASLPTKANQQAGFTTLMIDALENGKVQRKKVVLPVPGEKETCFEVGVACEVTAGQKRFQNSYNRPVHHILAHNDCICYLADSSNPSARCGPDRIHYYVEAWLGHHRWGERFYTFKYKSLKTGSFVSLGSADSLEQLLREVGKDLAKAGNKNKKLGDLVILTHGIVYKVNNQFDTVKMQLPLLSTAKRTYPSWTLPQEIDAAEIDELMRPGSNYYDYVDGPGENDGLLTVVLKGINQHVDDQTHIWFGGCSLGLNKKFMLSMRKLFAGKAVVYAFDKKHHLYVKTDANNNAVGGTEILIDARNRKVKVWTSKGIGSIIHVP